MTADDVADSNIKGYAIPILAIVKSSQQQHGLRHADYQRYHQYISRKLRRMRKSLHFQQGNRSKVISKKVTVELVTDPRFVLLIIFEIERSWAYAMQLRNEANTEPRKRFQMISRLRKAVMRSEQLSDLMNELPMLDAKTKLELRAYIEWIHGILSFELQDWQAAKQFLDSTRTIYTGLVETIEEEDGRGIYTTRIDEILPQIHYCAYNIGDKSAATDLQRIMVTARSAASGGVSSPSDAVGGLSESQLEELLSQARTGQVGHVTEVSWLGQNIPVKLEKVKVAILSVKEFDEEVVKTDDAQTKLSLYESTLKFCVEAIGAVRDELRILSSADAASVSSVGDKKAAAVVSASANVDKISRLQMLNCYLQWLKLGKTLDRTLLHVEMALFAAGSGQVKHGISTSAYSKPQELSRFYDTVVQNLQEMLSLPKVVSNCVGFCELLQAKLLAYKSYRCYYLAFTYNQSKRFNECSALLTRARRHATEATSALSTVSWTDLESSAAPGPQPGELIHQLNQLVDHIAAEQLTCRAARLLHDHNDDVGSLSQRQAAVGSGSVTETDETLAQKPLINRLDNFMDVKTVEKSLNTLSNPFVDLPPDFEPVPVKPIFFDLALNHINFPSFSDNLSTADSGRSGTGLAGFVRGWLWGGGNSEATDSTKPSNS